MSFFCKARGLNCFTKKKHAGRGAASSFWRTVVSKTRTHTTEQTRNTHKEYYYLKLYEVAISVITDGVGQLIGRYPLPGAPVNSNYRQFWPINWPIIAKMIDQLIGRPSR